MTKAEVKQTIREDLLDALQRRGVNGKQFEDMVEDYISLWEVKEKLIQDIKKRGPVVDCTLSNGTVNKRKNESVGDLLKVNMQMLKILEALRVKAPEGEIDVGADEM